MARILITGGTGFVGRHAVDALMAQGHDIHLISRSGRHEDPVVTTHAADILNRTAMDRLLEDLRPDWLLHMAWETEHGAYWHSPTNLDHVAASLALARKFVDVGGTRLVGAGTCAEYAWDAETTKKDLDEHTSLCAPHTLYGQAKLATFQMLEKFAQNNGVSFAWGRLFLLFGEREQERRLCPDIIRNLLNGQPVKCSSGRQIRDFMHSYEAGRAFAALLESDVTGPVNIASGQPMPLADFANKTAALAGRPDLIQLGALPDRPDDPPRLTASVARLTDKVGYIPSSRLDEKLKATITWWRKQLSSQE